MPEGGFKGDDPESYYRAEVHLSEGGQDYDVMDWRQEQLLLDLLQRYENHIHFLHTLN